jgi:thiol:disulfide interchange protein DsbD
MNRVILYFVLLIFTSVAAGEAVGDKLLEPTQAFKLDVSVKNASTVLARWDIAKGYYLYRNKITFQLESPGYRLGGVDIPAGQLKHDDFFGNVEIFRGHVQVAIAVLRASDASDTMTFTATSQGCADIGVCYPPQTQHITLTLAAAQAPLKAPMDPLASLKTLASDLIAADDEFLEPDQAFKFQVDVKDASTLVARWAVAEGYYLYRDKISFTLQPTQDVALGTISMAQGKVKHDEFFGRVEIIEHDFDVLLPLVRKNTAQTNVTLQTVYQGCAKAGLCYPPITKSVTLTLPQADKLESVADAATPGPGAVATTGTPRSPDPHFQSEQDRIVHTLAAGATWVATLSFFGFGLLLAFTPCVFPMIPILSGIIVGQGRSITTGKAFSLSLIYVLSMAITYTIVGVLVGLSGENVQGWFQSPWVLSSFAGLFVLLALSMFGFYELQMPSFIQTRLTQISRSQQGGKLAGVAVMGLLSALIVGPCVTAPLIGALIYIADTGDAMLGGLALFALSLGMGTPLLIIGTSAGKLLPKAGAWMDAIKAVFGVLLLGVGIWLLERILPIQIIMVLTGVLLIVSAIYMGALETIKLGASGWFRLWKGVGLIMLIYGALLLVGAAAGSHNLLQPLQGVLMANGSSVMPHGLQFEPIKGLPGLHTALVKAKAQNKPLMLDLYADWCISCKEMEAYTFRDKAVQAALKDTLLVQADVTANDDPDKRLLRQLGLFGPPAILFYTPDGHEQRAYRVVGFMPAAEFAQHVKKIFKNPITL